MASIDHRPRFRVGAGARAVSEELQELFTARIQSERVHLVALSAQLARAEECPTTTFEDLKFRAHRLRGAAATFEFRDLAAAAGTLERASAAASAAQAEHTDTGVWSALVALVEMLGELQDATFAIPPAETALPIG